jgi:hypothetical protein
MSDVVVALCDLPLTFSSFSQNTMRYRDPAWMAHIQKTLTAACNKHGEKTIARDLATDYGVRLEGSVRTHLSCVSPACHCSDLEISTAFSASIYCLPIF